MFASLVLAAALIGQVQTPGQPPPHAGILQTPGFTMIFFPGYDDKQKAYFAEYGMPSLGPFANRGHENHPFAFSVFPPDTPPGFYLVRMGRPWYLVRPW